MLLGLKPFDAAGRFGKAEPWWSENSRVGTGLSDLLQGITHGRMDHLYGHDPSYWKKKGMRAQEVFALLVELLGSGNMGLELAQKVAPHVTADVTERWRKALPP